MLTSVQWESARQVDHLSLPSFSFRRGFYMAHPRYRDPNNRPDLKFLDAWVTQFNTANNDFDRITALGSIIGATTTAVP